MKRKLCIALLSCMMLTTVSPTIIPASATTSTEVSNYNPPPATEEAMKNQTDVPQVMPISASDTSVAKAEINSEEYPMYYHSEDLNIDITQETYNGDTVCYVAHIVTDNPNYLKTEYAQGKWGGDEEQASSADKRVDSIFMVNGDYRNIGYGSKLGIVRNGKIVNDVPMASNAIGLTNEGHLVTCGDIMPQEVLDKGIRETFTFDPLLIKDGEKVPSGNYDIHPRTFIGEVTREDEKLEYYIIVADGRQSGYSIGLNYDSMTDIMLEKGCSFAYNLDGGGSSTMLFDHKLLNKPSDGQERHDADFIYFKKD